VQLRNAQFIVAWNRTDLMTRLSILARLVVNGERADLAVGKLIALVSLMASMLSSEARVAIAQQLRAEACCVRRWIGGRCIRLQPSRTHVTSLRSAMRFWLPCRDCVAHASGSPESPVDARLAGRTQPTLARPKRRMGEPPASGMAWTIACATCRARSHRRDERSPLPAVVVHRGARQACFVVRNWDYTDV
jgi:hypothetical protein